MTYQLQNLTPPQIARLDEVPIARQEQIIDQTGEPLRLVTSYYLVKNASANFTVPHETAYYAQQLSVNSWKIAGTVQTGQGQVMAATKDGRNMSVTVAGSDNGTLITLGVEGEAK
jgi:hypothetical protein